MHSKYNNLMIKSFKKTKTILRNLIIFIYLLSVCCLNEYSLADSIVKQQSDINTRQNSADHQISERMQQLLDLEKQQQNAQQIKLNEEYKSLMEKQKKELEQERIRQEEERKRLAEQERIRQVEEQKRFKRQRINQELEELSRKIARLRQLQQEAIAEAQQVHEIVTIQPNCQKYVTTRGWRNSCIYSHPDYHHIHYADLRRKVAADDIHVCIKAAEPYENSSCLLTHVITDRNNSDSWHKTFTVSKGVRAYIITADYWDSRQLCLNVKNETQNNFFIENGCFNEGSKIPLPYSDSVDQQFSINLPWTGNLGGAYVVSDHVNVDRTPVEHAQRKMQRIIADLEKQIGELETRKRALERDMPS